MSDPSPLASVPFAFCSCEKTAEKRESRGVTSVHNLYTTRTPPQCGIKRPLRQSADFNLTGPVRAGFESVMTKNVDDILTLLPARLKAARRAQGLSLEAVSNLSGVSRSMVSQIERGESSPTIATLWNLTRALQVDFAGLLDARVNRDRIEVLRASEVPSFDNMGRGCRIRILSAPEEAGGHEVYDIAFDLGGVLKSQPHTRGVREQLTVLEGTVRVTSGSTSRLLNPGDTARYAADVEHAIEAEGGAARVFLIVKTA
jgi:XRE family transcriptional regulator, regulator of sulfur utilization